MHLTTGDGVDIEKYSERKVQDFGRVCLLTLI